MDDQADPVVAGVGAARGHGRRDIGKEPGVGIRHRSRLFLGRRAFGAEHRIGKAGEQRRIAERQVREGEEHFDREDIGIFGAEIDFAVLRKCFNQFDRCGADIALDGADLAGPETPVEHPAIGAMFGRVHVHGHQLVLQPSLLGDNHHPRREVVRLIEELPDELAVRGDPVAAVTRSPDQIGHTLAVEAHPRLMEAMFDPGRIIDVEVDHPVCRNVRGDGSEGCGCHADHSSGFSAPRRRGSAIAAIRRRRSPKSVARISAIPCSVTITSTSLCAEVM